MIDIGRRGFLLAGGCAALVTGCKKPLTSRAGWASYVAYDEALREQAKETEARRDTALEAALLEETNLHRAGSRRAPLKDHPELARAAHAHLASMHAGGFFAHDTPDGFSAADRAGLICRSLIGGFGENLLVIEGLANPTAERFVGLWRESPGHNANMLKAVFTHAGHAVLRFGDKTYAAAVFGQIISVMKAPMPLETSGPALGSWLEGATPRIVDYVVSEPASAPYRELYPVSGRGPKLLSGAWRLRPLRAQAGQGLHILYGPIFIVT